MNARDLLPEPPQSDELFVTFANTLEFTNGIPTDHVAEPAALLAWLKENGLISERGRAGESARLHRDPREGERRMERFRYLRNLVHAIADRVNDHRQLARQLPRPGRSTSVAYLRQRRMSRDLHRSVPNRPPPLVRHARLRQSRQGGAPSVPCSRASGQGERALELTPLLGGPPASSKPSSQRGIREPVDAGSSRPDPRARSGCRSGRTAA